MVLGLNPGRDKKILLFSKTFSPGLEYTQLPIKCVPGFFPGLKWQGRETDHSPAKSAAVRNVWSWTTTPLPPCNSITLAEKITAFFHVDCIKLALGGYLKKKKSGLRKQGCVPWIYCMNLRNHFSVSPFRSGLKPLKASPIFIVASTIRDVARFETWRSDNRVSAVLHTLQLLFRECHCPGLS